ncbi:MAG: hypothetical protein IH910_04475 [Proteobacteria bacterium]|nr:hypothetical protein [Pseudomonadota bacterium]
MFRLLLMLMLLSAAPIVAQDSETGERSSTESSTETTDTDSADEINVDEIGESDTYSQADEGDFIPSDEVTYEQSVPYPTDI